MRRLTALAVLVGTCVAIFAMPAGANAAILNPDSCHQLQNRGADIRCRTQQTTPLAPRTHVGWAYLNLNYCPPTRICTAVYRTSMSGWSWGEYGPWVQRSINGGWVYIAPYDGAWRWAWTQQSGWVAVNSGRFELYRLSPGYVTG